MAKNKAAAVVAAVMTVVVTVVRILLIPKLTLPESGWWRWSYLAILLLVATVAAVFALGRFPKGEERRSIAGKPMLVTAVAGVLCGSLLTVVAVFDAGNWLFYEKTPPPNEEVISRLDAIALALMLLAGLLAGIAMVRCWFIWIGAGRTRSGIMRVWMPVSYTHLVHHPAILRKQPECIRNLPEALRPPEHAGLPAGEDQAPHRLGSAGIRRRHCV